MTRVANLKSDDSTISQFDYQYDPAGNKIRIATAAGGLTTYAYDKTYQLTEEWKTATGLGWSGLSADDWGDMTAGGWSGLQVNSPAAYRHTYSWDPTGNRVLEIKDGARTTSTFDAANQNVDSVNAAGRTTYTFDASGNRTGVEKPDGSRITTTYDFENRDIQAQLPTGIRNTMAYDPEGLRVLLQDSKGTTRFVYDNQQYLLETDGSNIITAVYSQEPGSYSNLNSQYRLTSGVWLPSYHHYDSLGSTMELTDADQGITDTYQYDAFGNLVSQIGETVNPFQWLGRVGYYLVTDTGLVYVIMRTYDPVAGGWTTLDVLRFVNGMNMYKAWFVPNRIDPSGLDSSAHSDPWGEWSPPPPPSPRPYIDPPSTSFQGGTCQIETRCFPVALGLGTHCGLFMRLENGEIYSIDGTGGFENNFDWQSAPTWPSGSTKSAAVTFPISYCECLRENSAKWNEAPSKPVVC